MILVINKIDCASSACSDWVDREGKSFSKHVFTCAITGQGIHDLEKSILEIVGLNKIPAGGRRWTVNQVRILKTAIFLLALDDRSSIFISRIKLQHNSLMLILTAAC